MLGGSLFLEPETGGEYGIYIPSIEGFQKSKNWFRTLEPTVLTNHKTSLDSELKFSQIQRTGSKNIPWTARSFMKPVGSLKFFKNPKPEVSWFWRFSKPHNQRFIKYKSHPVKIASYFAAPSRPTKRPSKTKAQHSILLQETCSADVENHQQMISGQRKQLRI